MEKLKIQFQIYYNHSYNNVNFIDRSETLRINSDDFSESIEYPETVEFLKEIFEDLGNMFGNGAANLKNFTVGKINEHLRIQSEIVKNVKKYSPIEDVRFNLWAEKGQVT